ncbi:heterokaryon incompatibility protein-domain-containing protein [Pseudoneurospora amorphoporcata]|uniref:Heterokaryon incompatibility protein-domain-containing protein n=1 Tax=Pseudoneurospora amorphoporcata TaxID=241081 RepID=A0AAN6NTJ4_9PEZI|nr:heterokaryon incompatibility protein-domain-containing protein [Pseudoneurospora amorphoporcata]
MTSNGVIPHVLCHRCSRIIHSDWVQERLARAKPWTGQSSWALDGDAGEEENLRFFHSESLEKLDASAAAGCHLCALISKKDQYFEWSKDEHHTGLVQVVAGAGTSSVWLETSRIQDLEIDEDMANDLAGIDDWLEERYNESHDFSGAWIMDDFVTVQLRKVRSDTYSQTGPDSNLPLSTSSDAPEILESMQYWLKDCVENHAECNRYSSTQKDPTATWFPTRVIDVGQVPGKLAPRLVISAAEGLVQKKAHYLTLSHSWSISTKANNLKLETENMAQLQDSIPLDDRLSKTFRDAMKITQQLGCRYIWIDSLCIIQSGPKAKEDWQREGLTMSDVYGHSRCNITALGTGGNDGCYTPRNPLQTSPCLIKKCDDKSTVYAVNSLLENTFTENVERSPLFKRGWVFQESVLSSRAVYFGAPQLFWECRRQAFAESWPFKTDTPRVRQRLTEPTLRAIGDAPFSSKTVFEALCNGEEQQMEEDTQEEDDRAKHLIEHTFPSFLAWEKIAKTFIGTSLTFTSDRLFAMAGIARAIEHFRSFTYVTGIWRELYPLDLLWRFTRELGARNNIISGSNAPSWSWAAKELDVKESLKNIAHSEKNTQRPDHWNGNKRFLVESVTSVDYLSELVEFPNPAFESKYRPDKEGEITIALKGRVRKGLVKTERDVQNYPEDRLYIEGKDPKSPVIVYMDDDMPTEGVQVLLVLLMRWEGLVSNYWKRQFQAGLVLVPAKNEDGKGGPTVYRRVGAFHKDEFDFPVNAFDGREAEEVLRIC